jgi:glycosyltransferase involved in cell wall biosynthesis
VKVTLISTVKDCADGVPAFLASLASQTRAPDEVVIVDGGSSDDTAARFRADDTVTLIEAPEHRGRAQRGAGPRHP